MEYNEESHILNNAQASQKVVSPEDKGLKTSVAIITGEKGKRKVRVVAAEVLTKEEAAREDAQYVAHNGSKNPRLN